MNLSRWRAIRDAGRVHAAVVVAEAVRVPASFVARAVLGPATMGIFATLEGLATLAAQTNLGAGRAAMREVAYEEGRGDPAAARRIEAAALRFTLFAGLASAVVVLGAARWFVGPIDGLAILGALAYGAAAFVGQLATVHQALATARRKFGTIAVATVVGGGSYALGVLALVPLLREPAFLAVIVAVPLVQLLVYAIHSGGGAREAPAPGSVRSLLRMGAPFAIGSLFFTVLLVGDRLVIAAFLGVEAAGVWSIVVMAKGYTRAAQGAIHSALHPRFQARYGRDGALALEAPLREALILAAAVFPLVLTVVYVGLQVAVVGWLPAFAGSLQALAPVLLGMHFLLAQTLVGLYVETVKRQWQLMVVNGACAALYVALLVGAVAAGTGIVGVGYATAAGYLVYLGATFGYAARGVAEKRRALLAAGATVAAGAYSFAAWSILDRLVPWDVAGWTALVAGGSLRAAGFLVLWAPVAAFAAWHMRKRGMGGLIHG